MKELNGEFNLENVTSLNLYGNKSIIQLDSVKNDLLVTSGIGLYTNIFIDRNFNN
jgi:hypothetical protein